MKFFAHNDLIAILGAGFLLDESVYSDSNLGFRFEDDAWTDPNYTERPALADWDTYYQYSNYSFKQYRNLLISQVMAGWGTETTVNKKIMVTRNVWPSTETTPNLDLLYTPAERDDSQKITMGLLDSGCDCRIVKSQDLNSTIYYMLSPNDAGALNLSPAGGITTDTVL